MGLDMFVYKIGKVSEEISEKLKAKPVHVDALRDEYGVSHITVDEYEESLESAIYPFFTKVPAIRTFWNLEKLWEDYHVPADCRISFDGCGWEPGYTELYLGNGKDGDELKTVTVKIPDSDEPKYLFDKEVEVYVFMEEEVAYWRKNYPLERWLKRHLLKTCEHYDNCQYFPVDDEMLHIMQNLSEIMKMPELFRDGEFDTQSNYLEYECSMEPVNLLPGEALFYWPWWW